MLRETSRLRRISKGFLSLAGHNASASIGVRSLPTLKALDNEDECAYFCSSLLSVSKVKGKSDTFLDARREGATVGDGKGQRADTRLIVAGLASLLYGSFAKVRQFAFSSRTRQRRGRRTPLIAPQIIFPRSPVSSAPFLSLAQYYFPPVRAPFFHPSRAHFPPPLCPHSSPRFVALLPTRAAAASRSLLCGPVVA